MSTPNKMDLHLSNLSEFIEKGAISKQEDRSGQVTSAAQHAAMVDSESREDENSKGLEASQEKKTECGNGDSESIKKKQQLKAAAEDPDCPDGHVPLSEDERLESLDIAEKRFACLIDDLNRLPITCDSFRVRNRKSEIEKELKSLEIDIRRVFSRSKAYVKIA